MRPDYRNALAGRRAYDPYPKPKLGITPYDPKLGAGAGTPSPLGVRPKLGLKPLKERLAQPY